ATKHMPDKTQAARMGKPRCFLAAKIKTMSVRQTATTASTVAYRCPARRDRAKATPPVEVQATDPSIVADWVALIAPSITKGMYIKPAKRLGCPVARKATALANANAIAPTAELT